MSTSVSDTLALKDSLEEATRRICSVGSPLKVVLFGSWARCDARPDSDVDLLIIEARSDVPRYRRATKYRMALTDILPDRDVDIVVWTTEEIGEWANVPQAFISTVIREGKTLYERSE
jgi:predicted nucleotidyltransferase